MMRLVRICMCMGAVLCAGGVSAAFATPLRLKLVDGNGVALSGATIIAQSEASKPTTAIVQADGTYAVDIPGVKISLVVQQPALGQKQAIEFALTNLPPGLSTIPIELRSSGQSLTAILPNAKGQPVKAPATPNTLSAFIPAMKAPSGQPGGPAGPGGSDSCATAQAIAGVGIFAFDNTAATMDGAADPSCAFFGQDQIDSDVWFCWTSDCDGTVQVETCGLTALDTKIAAYDGCACPSGNGILDCNDDACAGALQSSISFPAVSGQTYLLRIGTFPGVAGGTGQFSITCQGGGGPACPAGGSGDECTAPIVIGDGTFAGDTSDNTGMVDDTSCGLGDTVDEWYCYTATCTGTATANTCDPAATLDTTLAVFDSCGGMEIICNDDTCGLQSEVMWSVTAGVSYFIRVSGFNGSSGPFTLNVSCQAGGGGGANDDCANAEAIAGVGTFGFDNSAATTDGAPDASCTFFGQSQIDNDVWFCWTSDCDGIVQLETCGLTAIDTKIAVYDGCTCPTGNGILACNDDGCAPGELQSRLSFLAVSGQTYLIRIGTFPGTAGGMGQFSIVCQGPPPPTPCTEPAANCQAGDLSNASNSDGVNFIVADDFNCPAPGSINSICWWGTYLSGVPSADSFTITYYSDAGGVPGAIIGGPFSGAGLTITGPVNTGSMIAGAVPEFEYTATHAAVPVVGACYWVSISNALASGDTWFWEFGLGNGRALQDGQTGGAAEPLDGFDPSDVVQNDLKWCLDIALGDPTACLPPPASNDDCASAEAIAGEGTFPFDNSAATTDGLPDVLCDFFMAQQIDSDVWFCWTAPCTGDVRLETCGLTAVDTKIAVYDGCTCPTGSGILACNDDDCGLQSGLIFSAVMGQSYLIRIGTFPGVAGGVGSFSLTCVSLPANDLCDDAIPVLVPSTTSGTTDFATIDSGFPTPCGSASITSPGVWYSVIGTGNTMTASMCNGATAFDSKLSVFCRGCGMAICVDGNDDFCGLQSEVSWCSQAGVEYLILVHGFGGATGPFDLVLSDDGVACSGAIGCVVEPTGACCATDGTCTLDTATNCAAAGGAYQGDGTDCGSETPVAMPSSSPAVAIPDNDPVGVSDSLVMGMSFPIQDVNISLDVTHTWVGDLIVTVEHLGTTVTIVDRPGVPASTFGCPEDNYSIVLDDEGSGGAIEDLCAPGLSSPPNYGPNNPLSAFDGLDSAGTWTITISDNAGGDTGTLDTWAVTFNQQGTNPCGLVGACCVGTTCTVETDTSCAALGGAFQGAGTDCGGVTVVASPSSSPAVAIPDNDPVGVSDTLMMGMSFPISDVDIALGATHTWVGDLIVTVEHLGTTVTIIDRAGVPASTFGCPEDNYNIVLDDEGTGGAIEDQCSPSLTSPPNYAPENPLSAFDGMDSAGAWTITVSDNAGGDTGTLDTWSVIFSEPGASPCVPTCSPADCPPNSFALVDNQTGDFSGWCVTTPNLPDVDIFVDTVDLANGLVVIQVTKTFRNPPDPTSGLISPILLNFVQVCDDADTVNMIVITEEAVNNMTGAEWTDYHWTLFTTPTAWFDVAASSGFNVSPFTTKTFGNFLDSPTNNKAKDLDVADGGTVPSPGGYFPGFGTGGLKIGVDLSGSVPVAFTLKQRPTVAPPAATGACCLPPVPNCVDNGSFESGDFTSWTTQDLATPFLALQVGGAGLSPGFGLFTSAPTDGSSALLTGFDGDGPGIIRAAQDASIPAGATTLLFDYRAGWDLATFGATQDRSFTVKIEPAGGGAAMQTDLILTATAGTFMGDTGPLNGSVDVTAFAGSTVRVAFEWFVSENFSGPAFFQLDNVRCDLSGSACQDMTEADCIAAGGAYQGDNVPCMPDPCLPPPPPGACCTGGSCAMAATMDDCTAVGGVFQGEGTSCADCFICGVAPVTNDLCIDAVAVAVPSQTEGTNVGATPDGVPLCGTGETGASVWYSVIGTGNTITVTTCNECTDFDTKLSVYCGGCGLLNCVDGNDDNCTGFSGLLSSVSWCSEVGTEYLVLVHGFGGAEGNFRLDVSDDGIACQTPPSCAPPPMCVADFTVNGPGTFMGDTTGAGDDCNLSAGDDHIYEITLPNAGMWTFALCGSTFDTIMHVGTTCCSNDVGTNDDSCGLQSSVTATLAAGTYYVDIEGFGGAAGAYTLDVSKAPSCVSDFVVTAPGTFMGDTTGAGDDCDVFGADGDDHIYEVTIPNAGTWTFALCGSTFDTKIEVGTTCCSADIGSNDDSCGLQSSVSAVLTPGTYFVTVDGFGGAAGAYTLDITQTAAAAATQLTTLDIKPSVTPNPFAAGSNGVLPVGILGTASFSVAAIDTSSLRLSRLDGTGGLVAPYESTTGGPHTTVTEVGTPDGFADLLVNFDTSVVANVLKLGALPTGTTVEILITGSRVDGTAFKAMDTIVVAPLTKGHKFVTVTSNATGVWIDAVSMDANADMGGFANFLRCYGDQDYVTSYTAPAIAAGNMVFRRWVLDGVAQPIGIRSIRVPLSGDHSLEAKYVRPRRISPDAEIRPGAVGPRTPLQ